jgi:hypothetical protein
MTRDLNREQLLAAIQALGYLVGADEPLSQSFGAALKWLKQRWDAGDDFLPFLLVHDLGHLLLRGRDYRFASGRDLSVWPEHERALRLRYEDKLLGRWTLDPSVREAHVAIAGMPDAQRDAAIAHAVGLALAGPLRAVADLSRGNPAHLRALLQSMPSVWVDVPETLAARRELVEDAWLDWAMWQLELCIEALPERRLFSDEDLWEVAHLPDLPSESARLNLRELHEARRLIGPIPAGVALEVKRRAQEVPMEQQTSDRYPAGGFDAVATKGVFENMVRSEIAYVGEGGEGLGGIDLFDVRFVEGELLFYTRDESPLLDQRRDVTLVIDRPAEQRTKLAKLPAQTLVLVQGVCLALQQDLVHVFGPSGARVHLLWRADAPEDLAVAEEELALMSLSLKAEVAHRRVHLDVARSWGEVPERRRVVFSPHTPRSRKAETPNWVRVGGEVWRLGEHVFDATRYDRLRLLTTELLARQAA